MIKHWPKLYRKMAPFLCAGLLLQTGGCTFDSSALLTGLFTLILNNIITDLVFGFFNLPI